MDNNNDLKNFYYDILNIGKKNDVDDFKKISNVVSKIKKELLSVSSDISGLCKVSANNISYELGVNDINSYIFNTKDILGGYEHIFVITYYKDNDTIKHVLIDPTYEQFVEKSNHILSSKFVCWPSRVLQKTIPGRLVLDNLLKDGFSVVDQYEINLYLGSFINEIDPCKINFNLDDIMFNINKGKNK